MPLPAMDSTKASTGCRTSWKMLIAKFDKRFFLCFDYYIWNEENQTEIIILLEKKRKNKLVKWPRRYELVVKNEKHRRLQRCVLLYISRPTKWPRRYELVVKNCFFLLLKNIFTFSPKKNIKFPNFWSIFPYFWNTVR